MARLPYPSDLSDAEWALLRPHLEVTGGRPQEHSLREIANAIFYRLKTGCQWRYLPHDFPPWKDVWYHWNKWQTQGMWEEANAALREQVRVQLGHEPTPSAAIADTQSVKTTEKGGLGATTEPRRSRAESATSSSTPKASSSA